MTPVLQLCCCSIPVKRRVQTDGERCVSERYKQASQGLLAVTLLDFAVNFSLNSSYPDIVIVHSSRENNGAQVILKITLPD